MRFLSCWLVLAWALSVTLGADVAGAQSVGANRPGPAVSVETPAAPTGPDAETVSAQELRRGLRNQLGPQTPEGQSEPRAAEPRAAAAPETRPEPGEPADAPEPLRSEQASQSEDSAGQAYSKLPLAATGAVDGAGEADDAGAGSDYGGGGNYVLNTLAALGLVIALILLLRWGWLKMSGQRQVSDSPAVEVLSRTAVAPKNHVLLLRVGERVLVVGDSSAGGLRTLSEIDDPEQVAELLGAITAAQHNSISNSFSQLLGRFGKDYDEIGRSPTLEGGDDDEHVMDRTRDSVSGLLSRVRSLSGKGDV